MPCRQAGRLSALAWWDSALKGHARKWSGCIGSGDYKYWPPRLLWSAPLARQTSKALLVMHSSVPHAQKTGCLYTWVAECMLLRLRRRPGAGVSFGRVAAADVLGQRAPVAAPARHHRRVLVRARMPALQLLASLQHCGFTLSTPHLVCASECTGQVICLAAWFDAR